MAGSRVSEVSYISDFLNEPRIFVKKCHFIKVVAGKF